MGDIPPLDLLLTAIEDIAQSYGLGDDKRPSVLQGALAHIANQASLALAVHGVDHSRRPPLRDEWMRMRASAESPVFLRHPEFDRLAKRMAGLMVRIARASPSPPDASKRNFEFEYHCDDCGGFVLSIPDDGDRTGAVFCKACGRNFGPYGALLDLCHWMARNEVVRAEIAELYGL